MTLVYREKRPIGILPKDSDTPRVSVSERLVSGTINQTGFNALNTDDIYDTLDVISIILILLPLNPVK